LNDIKKYGLLLVSFFIYASTCVFTKGAATQVFLSWQYILLLGGAVLVMGIYAILWQQVIRIMLVSDAFMFKGTSLLWTMLFSYCLFGESISWKNIWGVLIVIIGITLYAYVDKKEGKV